MKKVLLLLAILFISFGVFAQTADTTLHGTLISKAPDVTTVTYLWTQVSGPTISTISSPTTLVTDIKNLSVGVYIYQLVGIDNFGISSAPSQVKVTVLRIGTPPVVNAGPDIIIQSH